MQKRDIFRKEIGVDKYSEKGQDDNEFPVLFQLFGQKIAGDEQAGNPKNQCRQEILFNLEWVQLYFSLLQASRIVNLCSTFCNYFAGKAFYNREVFFKTRGGALLIGTTKRAFSQRKARS